MGKNGKKKSSMIDYLSQFLTYEIRTTDFWGSGWGKNTALPGFLVEKFLRLQRHSAPVANFIIYRS